MLKPPKEALNQQQSSAANDILPTVQVELCQRTSAPDAQLTWFIAHYVTRESLP